MANVEDVMLKWAGI